MAALREDESRILGLLADNPQKYKDLLELLNGDALKIGEGLVHNISVDAATADAVKEAKEWAQQSRVRTA
jgi:hypothetical protein